MFWYSEKQRLNQVNKKLELLSQLGINSSDDKLVTILQIFLLKLQHQVIKNLNLDPRWLEVNPKHNPILRKNNRLVFHNLKREFYIFSGNHLCKVSIKITLTFLIILISRNKVKLHFDIDSNGNYKKFGISNWNYNDNIPINNGSIVISDYFELKNKLLFEKLINWISSNFDYLNINFSIINKSTITEINPSNKDLVKTYNNLSPSSWGITGLIDSPSARFRPEGSLLLQINETHPIRRYNVIFSPFDWFEGGFRYVSIQNRYYSNDPEFSGTQSYKDKNFEFKARLLKETNYLPQLAIGFRDFAGTGLFSSEYLTSSKRFGNLDLL